MSARWSKIITVCHGMVIVILALSKPGHTDTVNNECENPSFTPRNCKIQPNGANELAMYCYRPFLDSRFQPKMDSEQGRRCHAQTTSLVYFCQDPKRSSDLTNLTFDHFPNLEQLHLADCNFLQLFRTNLERTKLRYLSLANSNTNNKNENRHSADRNSSFTLDPGSIRQQHLEKLTFSGMNIHSVPPNEFCNVRQILDLSNNAMADIYSLSLGLLQESNTTNNETCGQYLITLDLSSNHFEVLPNRGFSNLKTLTRLDLRDNKIREINEKAFDNMNNLEYLYMQQNNIGNVTGRLWQDMVKLIGLTLDSNSIKGALTFGAFENLDQLLFLNLTFNQIASIEFFPKMTALSQLHLGHNLISEIKNGAFFNLAELFTLDLNNNQIATITRTTFEGLKKLFALDLRENKIEHIDFDAFHSCPNLFLINLFSNRLKHIPDFTLLSNLGELHISGNEISSLPEDSFINATELKFVSLGSNLLTHIPELLFANNTNLETVHLYDNRLTEITEELFVQNDALVELQLNNNSIDRLSGLKNLSHLNNLDMQYNIISDLDFALLPYSLININVSHNNITKFNVPYSYLYRNQIKTLDVSYNKLQTVPFEFVSLTHLNISHNDLTRVKPQSFYLMDGLAEVDIRDNQLVTLEHLVLELSMMSRAHFLLEGNQLRCDCTTAWLKDYQPTGQNYPKYGDIQDINKIKCTVRLLGQTEVQIMYLVHVPKDWFLCEFQQDSEQVDIYTETLEQYQHADCANECLCYFNHNWSLIITYCSNRQLITIPRHMPSTSVIIYLDGNNIDTLIRSSLDDYEFVTKLYINSSMVQIIQDNVFQKMIELQELHLENNRLKSLGTQTFSGLHQLSELYLQSNELHMLHPQTFLSESLEVLQLDNNALTNFPPFDLNATTTITSLTLSQNKWDCQCTNEIKQNLYLLDKWSNRIVDRNQTTCHNPTLLHENLPLFKFYAEKCDGIAIFPILQISVVLSVLVVVAVVAILIFIYRHEMQVLLYSRYEFRLFRQMEDESAQDSGKVFDAFVAYSSLDEAFVVEELLPKLEGCERPFRLCVHHRDFKVGGFITNSILEAVEFSRRTIVVMSENFASSNWCRFEFKSAHVKMMEDRCRRLIMIVLGDVPNNLDPEVQLYFKTNTYLQRSDRLFWEKLYFAMPKRGLQANTLELTPIENAGQ